MPVTLTTAQHGARQWKTKGVTNAKQLLKDTSPKDYNRSKQIIRASIPEGQFTDQSICASTHGFVKAVFHAYTSHHHLIIRPEDVWFSILVQLNFYVNANAEELRSFFVAHKGQKELEVVEAGTINSVDFGALAIRMTQLIEKNVLDPELRNWIMPDFTTTQKSDLVVASILMMGALQKYFSYKMTLTCGIPTVTLLGEREDWAKMVGKLDMLHQLGEEPTLFALLLKPVLERFVASFDDPKSPEVLNFWSTCAHETGGSGPFYLSGWVTAFCFWNEDGRALYPKSGPTGPPTLQSFAGGRAGCQLDGILYHRVNTDDIPSGLASVPVRVNDNGTSYDTRMVAGLVGISATSSGAMLDEGYAHVEEESFDAEDEVGTLTDAPGEATGEPGLDTIQPLSGWWMYETEGAEESEARETEKKRLRGELDILNKQKREESRSENREAYDATFERWCQLYQKLEELEAF